MKTTIWKAVDRQGLKYFSAKPEFNSAHDVFLGTRCELPADRKTYRLVKNFKAKVTGSMAGRYGYPLILECKF